MARHLSRRTRTSAGLDSHDGHGRRSTVERPPSAPATTDKILLVFRRLAIETIPAWIAVGAVFGLIFGGCCSNVYALEAIVKLVALAPQPSFLTPEG